MTIAPNRLDPADIADIADVADGRPNVTVLVDRCAGCQECGSSGTNVGDRAGMTCGFSLLVNGFGVGGEGG